jgi:hypothetical protein
VAVQQGRGLGLYQREKQGPIAEPCRKQCKIQTASATTVTVIEGDIFARCIDLKAYLDAGIARQNR